MTSESFQEAEKRRLEEKRQKLADLFSHEAKNYHIDETSPRYERSGGGRDLFELEWGPHRILRLTKSDMPLESLKTPGGIRTVIERGCDTSNELSLISGIEHPGVTKLLDYIPPETTAKYNLSGTITVEEYFQDSQSLEEITSDSNQGPLRGKMFNDFVMQTAAIVRDVIHGTGVKDGRGFFHRDLKPNNFLIRKSDDGRIEVKITDWANGCPVDKPTLKYMPTAGGHLVTDPLLMSPFTGEKAQYNVQSEIYELVSSDMFASRGIPVFDYNPDTRRAVVWDSGENVLDLEGRLDINKHLNAAREAVRKLPRHIRNKFGRIFMKGLTLDETQRYGSIDEFYSDLERAEKREGLSSRLKKWGLVAASAALIGAAGIGYYLSTRNKDVLEEKLYEEQIRASTRDRVSVIKREYSYTDTMDALARKRLRMWLEKFCEFDKEKYDYKGDKRTAFACYIETIWDKKLADKENEDKKFGDNRPPITVYTAIQMSRGKTDYETLEPIIEKLNPDLYWAVKEATSSSIDGFARGYLPDETEKRVRDDLWKNAKQGYETRKAEEERERKNKAEADEFRLRYQTR